MTLTIPVGVTLVVSHTVGVQTSDMVTVLPGFSQSWLGAVVLLGFLWMHERA